MEAKLLPCPFCGTVEMLRRVGASDGEGWGFVRCDYCDAEGPDVNNFPGGWNHRAAMIQPMHNELAAALAREAGLRKTLEWVQHNGNFAHRDNIMSVVNNALEVKP